MTRLTEQQLRDRSLSEADLRDQVEQLALILGYETMLVGPLRTSHGWRTPTRGTLGEGWPDTTFIHRRSGRIVFAEFKAEKGSVSPAQRRVHEILRAAGHEVHVIRPSSFDWFVGVLRS